MGSTLKKSRISLRLNRGIFFQGDNRSINVIVTGIGGPRGDRILSFDLVEVVNGKLLSEKSIDLTVGDGRYQLLDDPTPEGIYIKVRGSYNRHRTGLNVPITYYYNHDQYVVSHYRNNSPK